MVQTSLPKMNMDKSETGCCPRFDPTAWEGAEIRFDRRRFVKDRTVSFLHIPLNIGSVFQRTFERILAANAASDHEYLILSTDTSPWRAEHYFAVERDVPGAEMIDLSGTFLTKVFEGPFSQARNWCGEMRQYVQSQDKELHKLYFFYTTCPKCAKHYGKNYVVAFAEV